MAEITADRVYETSTTTGTGTYTLAGAIAGYRAFSAVCANSDTVRCFVEEVDANGVPNGGWEIGIYTWGTGGTLARTTVEASSNAGAAVSWATGTRRIGLGVTASRLALISPSPALALADYAWVNQLAATATEASSRITMVGGTAAADSWNILKKSLTLGAGQTLKLTAYGAGQGAASPANQGMGLILRESGTGKFVVFMWQPNASSAGGAFVWTNPTTFASTVIAFPLFTPKISPKVFTARYTGTQWYFAWSVDGLFFTEFGPYTISSFSPNEAGFGVNSVSSTSAAVLFASRLEVV